VLQVCQTDCVKVENLDISTGNDAIRMAFMNRNNGCTGKVTKVERVQQGMDFLVFVYFANFKGNLKPQQCRLLCLFSFFYVMNCRWNSDELQRNLNWKIQSLTKLLAFENDN